MSANLTTEDEYEDLLGQWSDLEAGLSVILRHPQAAQEFEQRLYQFDRWMQDLIQRDTDLALYLLFQLASQSRVGYSTSHALMCAVLCQVLVPEFRLAPNERNSLVRSALTMNISMTLLQDELAVQLDKPTPEQQAAIATHADKSAMVLGQLGINNTLWLDTVGLHHQESFKDVELQNMLPEHRLAYILHVVDRYAAMISPRRTREGRSAADSAQNILQDKGGRANAVGEALLRVIGLCPPGTFVRLMGKETAIVLRRSSVTNQPDVAMVLDGAGQAIRKPLLQQSAQVGVEIQGFVSASTIQERINHHLILQLGTTPNAI